MISSWVFRIVLTCIVAGAMPAAVQTADGRAGERTFALDIQRNHLPPEKRTLRVKRGDTVTLDVTADRALVMHIHAFRLELAVNPGTPARLTFPAHATGRFPIEIHVAGAKSSHHHHGPPLAYLEVMPK